MLRVIAGKYKGKHLYTTCIENARPTLSRGRQVVFDMLASIIGLGSNTFSGMCVIDCFAGTGALGIEAASRGASEVIFIEKSKNNCNTIRKNATFLEEKVNVINSDLFRLPQGKIIRGSVDLVFIDPPYNQNLANSCLKRILNNGWLRDSALLVLETESEADNPKCSGYLHEEKTRTVSRSKFIILRAISRS
ncbi:MAG: 16S rRNA (guanine(966)-N(2))-methyltransferase RsmD [Holosporales bacterium]|jgi:16S rRNA (guanine966-N2)-methyltransferase|nr:16S rRNA (guanine(966)-N(2))-methyltransferase RsmD [Holosporales bacterium]